MPRPSNQEVRDAFEEIPAENGDAKVFILKIAMNIIDQ